jgi:squalene synthase HpnC
MWSARPGARSPAPVKEDQVGSPTSAAEAEAVVVLGDVAARSIAQMSGENFPVALRLLPRRPRTHLSRVYQYARFVDDVGDEAPGDRLALLDIVEADVRRLETELPPRLEPVRALQPTMTECDVPIQPLLDLIEANRVDQTTLRYESFDDLMSYCRLSANPVGRLVLHIAGAATAENIADSDTVCSALQVLEHCQDVGEDAHAGRIYLPGVDLRAAGVEEAELLLATTSAALEQVVAVQVDRARGMLRSGRGLVRRLSGWSRLAVAGYVAGGTATVHALRTDHYDVLSHPVRPSHRRTALIAVRLSVGF